MAKGITQRLVATLVKTTNSKSNHHTVYLLLILTFLHRNIHIVICILTSLCRRAKRKQKKLKEKKKKKKKKKRLANCWKKLANSHIHMHKSHATEKIKRHTIQISHQPKYLITPQLSISHTHSSSLSWCNLSLSSQHSKQPLRPYTLQPYTPPHKANRSHI